MFKALSMHYFLKSFWYNTSNTHNYLNYTSLVTITEELEYLSGFRDCAMVWTTNELCLYW